MRQTNPSLVDMNLSPPALSALQSIGYVCLEDLRPLSSIEILCIPNVGGKSYKRILAALGRS